MKEEDPRTASLKAKTSGIPGFASDLAEPAMQFSEGDMQQFMGLFKPPY